jgi:hypothetical protein
VLRVLIVIDFSTIENILARYFPLMEGGSYHCGLPVIGGAFPSRFPGCNTLSMTCLRSSPGSKLTVDG